MESETSLRSNLGLGWSVLVRHSLYEIRKCENYQILGAGPRISIYARFPYMGICAKKHKKWHNFYAIVCGFGPNAHIWKSGAQPPNFDYFHIFEFSQKSSPNTLLTSH